MTRCVLFSYDIKRLLFNTLFGFFLMMAMLGNGYAAPTTLSTVAELERYGLVVKGNSGLRLTREGTNVVQIHLYERYLTNPTDSPYQVTTNNGVVSIEIELDSEAHETLRSMEDQLHSQFVTTYNDIAYRLTHPHNLEQTYNMLGLLLNRYTEIVVPRFATPNTLDAPIETVAAETQTDPQQTDTPQTVAAEIQADPPQTDPPQIVAAEIQADTPQTGTPQTVEAEILIGTSQAVEAETQADTPQTDTPQTDPPQTVAAEIQADTPQTVAAETPIDSTPTFEEGIQNTSRQHTNC